MRIRAANRQRIFWWPLTARFAGFPGGLDTVVIFSKRIPFFALLALWLAPLVPLHAVQNDLVITKRYLHFPVANKATPDHRQRLEVLVDGAVVREFDIRMTDHPDWFAHLDMSAWHGKTATLRVAKLAADSKLLELVTQADTIWNPEQLYREPLRAQLRFSARRGWINDPNGMVFADGEYHLYFQANPYGCGTNKKWVLTAASSEYLVGTFDGGKFTPETAKLPGHRGRGFYAAQTFSNEPQGRVVQIGWLKTGTPGMPFNQAMSLPHELKLRRTANGPQLTWTPVTELQTLRDGPNHAGELDEFRAELIELRAEFEPGDAGTIEFNLRGATLAYDTKNQELLVNGLRVPAPLVDGKQRLIVYVDRTALEVFASDGLTYVPLPFIPKQDDQSVSVGIKGGNAKMNLLQVYKLKSIWK